jgi:hypothetical protein
VLLFQAIDGDEAARSPLVASFQAAGFTSSASGLSFRQVGVPLDEEPLL